MSYKILFTPEFSKEIKRLSKKYISLKIDFAELLKGLEKNPEMGTSIGNNCYKIRLSISSKNKGNSGGARVITHVAVINKQVILISIYDKTEQSTITSLEVSERLKKYI